MRWGIVVDSVLWLLGGVKSGHFDRPGGASLTSRDNSQCHKHVTSASKINFRRQICRKKWLLRTAQPSIWCGSVVCDLSYNSHADVRLHPTVDTDGNQKNIWMLNRFITAPATGICDWSTWGWAYLCSPTITCFTFHHIQLTRWAELQRLQLARQVGTTLAWEIQILCWRLAYAKLESSLGSRRNQAEARGSAR